ncbi:5-formyltetrahydrofolate cyclo-ligase [Saxibacter everestensis]|uniref:5-formyltetrahydrofolate cyclo-ligase n=1 Tax=Saxibacter everestensis TaxID=2909229 RepID=A0ABY8QV40_9MICO|nr:5-formyltetrahydrofolate cyclo-ligase [Brevibacteriaceae bacterium ZFBP1038]
MRTETKPGIRRVVRQARRAMPAEVRRDAAEAFEAGFFAIQDGVRAVAGYLPLATEPDIEPLLRRARNAGTPVYLPVAAPERTLCWALDSGRYSASAIGGGPEPIGERLSTEDMVRRVDVILVPALAVDRAGHRLGQGGGYYDRAFAALITGQVTGQPRPSLNQSGPGLSLSQSRPSLSQPAKSGVRRPEFWAVVYDDEVLENGALPAEQHDLIVDAALTPSGLLRCTVPA